MKNLKAERCSYDIIYNCKRLETILKATKIMTKWLWVIHVIDHYKVINFRNNIMMEMFILNGKGT